MSQKDNGIMFFLLFPISSSINQKKRNSCVHLYISKPDTITNRPKPVPLLNYSQPFHQENRDLEIDSQSRCAQQARRLTRSYISYPLRNHIESSSTCNIRYTTSNSSTIHDSLVATFACFLW